MSPLLSMSDLDNQAAQITEQRPDQNVFELDLTLWNLLATLCRHAPSVAREQFSLPQSTVVALAATPPHQLSKLASGVVLSFQLHTPEPEVSNFLSAEYERAIPPGFAGMEGVEREFDVTYWLTLRNLARRDAPMAATAFGVSHSLAKAVAEATDNQIRQLVTEICTACTLRFGPEIVEGLLPSADLRKRRQAFFIKYQQSLSVGGNV